MNVFVTGGSGFVGTHLVHHLTESGDTVWAPMVDITNPGELDAALASAPGGPPSVVYHLAGQADVGLSWNDVHLTWMVNTVGTVNVLEALFRHAPKARVVLVSSAEVYGRVSADDLPIAELRPTSTSSPYGASKIAAEVAGLFAANQRGQHVVIARPFNHIGVGQSPGFILPAVAKQIAEAERDGLDIVRLGNLDAQRDLTAVQDVVRAYRLLAQHGNLGEIYNICRSEPVRIGDLVDAMVAKSLRPLRVELDPERLRPSDIPIQFGDSTKLRKDTGWEPVTALDDVLRNVLDEWRTRVASHGS
jgi:GDP-4-dehydro-6-deoxy-D-mannose reductase